MMLPFAVASIAAVSTVVRAGEISPGVALISQRVSAVGPMAEGLDTVIAAPVVGIVDNLSAPTAPAFSEQGSSALDKLFEKEILMPTVVNDPMVLVAAIDESGPNAGETVLDVKDIEDSDVILLPEPLSYTNLESHMPGWHDEQKLTLETFKEIVATDVDNVWVIAYVDPRCRDCIQLSIEWERLTQIEEKVKRKIKLGYVDISVTENWKIIQDHTKGRKLTHTPAITLYGDNKESPFWYSKEDQATAEGVHSWVSSYADHFGYGYWDPEQYQGPNAIPYHRRNYLWDDGIDRNGYGIGARYAVDTKRHDGALGKAGVAIGRGGKGYLRAGKWIAGDQVTALKHDGEQTVMLRRTVTKGGQLSGLAHNGPSKKLKQDYHQQSQAVEGAQPQSASMGGSISIGSYGRQRDQGGYGKSKDYGAYYGKSSDYGGKYGGYGYFDSFSADRNRPNSYQAAGNGSKSGNGYGQRSRYGSSAKNGYYGDQSNSYNNNYGGTAYDSGYGSSVLPTIYRGTYGNAVTRYFGPGLDHLEKLVKDGQYETRVDGKTGKLGIVLGKYKKTKTDTKTITEHDEVEIGGPDSQMYKDAYDLATQSGMGYSVLDEGFFADTDFADMNEHYIQEDTPEAVSQTRLQETPQVPEVNPNQHYSTLSLDDYSVQASITAEEPSALL